MTHAATTLDEVAQSVTDLRSTVDNVTRSVTELGVTMNSFATKLSSNIDDVAESVTVLGTMVGEQLASFRQELKADIMDLRTELKAEISDFRHDFDTFRREADVGLSNLEGEASATRNNLREIYDRLTSLEKRVINAAKDDKAQIRQELDDLKQWARDISAETGFPKPKF